MPPPLGIIKVIHAALSTSIIALGCRGVMTITTPQDAELGDRPDKRQRISDKRIMFKVEGLVGTTQSHDNALVLTILIGQFDVMMEMINQGRGEKIMYPDLY